MNKSFSVIGVGNIARAFLNALDQMSGKFEIPKNSVTLYNRTPDKISGLLAAGYNSATSAAQAAAAGDYIFLGVKPQNLAQIFTDIKNSKVDLSSKTIISPCAGVTCKAISALSGASSVIRIMPNTPMQIGKGVTEICRTDNVSDRDYQYICRIFSVCGEVISIKESEMNAMTAATSSAVAYVYRMISAVCNAASASGADTPMLERAVAKTFIGAAEMLLASEHTADELVAAVRSPNGTTEQALRVFDQHNLEEIISEAVKACADRAEELGNECELHN